MRTRLVAFLVPLLGLLGLFECGPVSVPPNPELFNDCSDNCASFCPKGHTCAVQCATTLSNDSACVTSLGSLQFILVVDVPQGAEYAPGQTFVLTTSSLSFVQSAQKDTPNCDQTSPTPCCRASTRPLHSTCVPLPPLAGLAYPFGTGPISFTNPVGTTPNTSGYYVANSSLSHQVGVDFGGQRVSLPAQFSLTPDWAIAGTTYRIPPSLLGLPVPAVEGSIVSPFPGGTAPDGPSLAPMSSVGWVSFNFAGALPSELAYRQSMEVLPPFESFPPAIDPGVVEPWEPGASPGPPPPSGQVVCVSLPAGEDPAGWTVVFREVLKQRILSSVGHLGVVAGCSTLSRDSIGTTVYSFVSPLSGESVTDSVAPNVVVSPPPSHAPIPSLIETFIDKVPQVYPPALPLAAKVSGTVLFGGTNIAAELHFVGTSFYVTKGAGCMPASGQNLVYDVVVATDAKHVGEYTVTLPEGEYSVTINPDPATGAPQTTTTLSLPLEKCPAPTQGITVTPLNAGNPIGVFGSVNIHGPNGKLIPVPYATVDLTPSLSPFTSSGSPSMPPSPTVPRSPIDLPKSFEVTTDADGGFSFTPEYQAYVGSGPYDLTVRPAEGTRLPWVITAAHLITGSKSSSGSKHNPFTITIPVPGSLRVTLHDPLEGPIVDALVRAYAFPCPSQPCFSAANQIGQAFTDGTGSFEMFLAPEPFVLK